MVLRILVPHGVLPLHFNKTMARGKVLPVKNRLGEDCDSPADSEKPLIHGMAYHFHAKSNDASYQK
jgi:hypothetical protein